MALSDFPPGITDRHTLLAKKQMKADYNPLIQPTNRMPIPRVVYTEPRWPRYPPNIRMLPFKLITCAHFRTKCCYACKLTATCAAANNMWGDMGKPVVNMQWQASRLPLTHAHVSEWQSTSLPLTTCHYRRRVLYYHTWYKLGVGYQHT